MSQADHSTTITIGYSPETHSGSSHGNSIRVGNAVAAAIWKVASMDMGEEGWATTLAAWSSYPSNLI
jgi:hypothetical protein